MFRDLKDTPHLHQDYYGYNLAQPLPWMGGGMKITILVDHIYAK